MTSAPRLALRGATLVTPDGVARRDLAIVDGVLAAPAGGEGDVALDGHLVFPALVNAHDHLALDHLPRQELGTFPNAYAWIEAFQPRFADPALARALAVPEGVRIHAGALKNALSGALAVAHHDPLDPKLLRSLSVAVVPCGWAHSIRLAGRYGAGLAESRAATPPGAPWLVHLAEGTDDVAAGELAALDELSLLDERTVLVHGVGLSWRDVDRVLAADASVVWCPSSNLAILGRTLDPRRLFDAGRLALGTDSRLTGAFDPLAELRVAAASSDLSPRELLRLATSDGARVLRLAPRGALAPGEPADLLVLQDAGGDPYERLLSARRANLAAVIRGGRPLVADAEIWERLAPDAPFADVLLDGAPKRVDPELLRPPEAARLEPRLALQEP